MNQSIFMEIRAISRLRLWDSNYLTLSGKNTCRAGGTNQDPGEPTTEGTGRAVLVPLYMIDSLRILLEFKSQYNSNL